MATTYSASPASRDYDVRATAGVNDLSWRPGDLLAVVFVSSGLDKFMGFAATTAAIASTNLPMPHVLAIDTAAVELGGGLLIMIARQMRSGRGRHFDVLDAEFRQRVDHRIDDRRQAPTQPASPAPLVPSGLVLVGTGLASTSMAQRLCARGMA